MIPLSIIIYRRLYYPRVKLKMDNDIHIQSSFEEFCERETASRKELYIKVVKYEV